MGSVEPGVVDYSDDPILPAWYVPGWTSQNQSSTQYSIAAPQNIQPFTTLPSSLVYIHVNANFNDGNGNQLGGYLTFEQSNDLLILDPVTGSYYRVPARMVGNIPIGNILAWNAEGSGKVYLQFGQLNVMLLATDQPNVTVTVQVPYDETQEPGYVAPVTWVYHVKEYFMNGYEYDISVPSTSNLSGPVDINTLIIPGTMVYNPDWHEGY